MKITIVTLFPDMIRAFIGQSIVNRAQEKGQVEIEIVDLREFGEGNYKTVDDRPYGGGAGMVLMADPLKRALFSVKNENSFTILTSAKGSTYDQKKAQELAQKRDIVIVCGHYEGVDERVLKYIDEEISLGDFVMTGGEIPSCAILDSVVRLLPGVLKKDTATEEESFFEVSVDELMKACPGDAEILELQRSNITKITLLEYPHFTRPEEYEGEKVPEILLSGDHKRIREWRIQEAYSQTKEKRPDLLQKGKE